LARYIDLFKRREEEIRKIIELLFKKSKGFEDPKLILIGGYGLRAYVPFSRSTRDCDFAIRKKNGWQMDEIKGWFGKEISVETLEKKENFAFMRCIKPIKVGTKTVKVSLDFMEGEVTGRNKKDVVKIDERFVKDTWKTRITVAGGEQEVRVPSYTDFFILKVVSARASDVRDIATLIWKNGIPERLKERIGEILPHPGIFNEKLGISILPIMRDKRFVDSWRGIFMTTEFDDKVKEQIIDKLSKLLS
jgi:hypothetical protein